MMVELNFFYYYYYYDDDDDDDDDDDNYDYDYDYDCPDILNNDWAASRSQSMQRPKSLQLKSQLLIIKILVIKF